MPLVNHCYGNYYSGESAFAAGIQVAYDVGARCTCSDGSTTLTAPNTSGKHTFIVPHEGTWTVTVVLNSFTETQNVNIKYDCEYKSISLFTPKAYGIKRDTLRTPSKWERTDSAVGKNATASVGSVAGSSDFDNCYPWSEITRVTLPTGDVMVKIPKFWYRRYRTLTVEHIIIADKPMDNFTLHPAFDRGGKVKDYIYVGAYKTSGGIKSVSGALPLVTTTRDNFRSNARSKGRGWYITDISTLSAIQMLILVEFADYNVQKVIGRGYCDGNTSSIRTGTCDNVSGLTGRPSGTDGKVDVVWRGIEGLWGNVYELIDGINWLDAEYYVCNDPSKYRDNTSTDYTALSSKGSTDWKGKYISMEVLDNNNSHVMVPNTVSNKGKEDINVCDMCYGGTGWCIMQHGGAWGKGSNAGLFTAAFDEDSTFQSTNSGCRLLYIP